MSSLTNALPKSHDFISPPVASSKGHVSPLPNYVQFYISTLPRSKIELNFDLFFFGRKKRYHRRDERLPSLPFSID